MYNSSSGNLRHHPSIQEWIEINRWKVPREQQLYNLAHILKDTLFMG